VASALPASPDGKWHYLVTCTNNSGAGGWSTGYANRQPILATDIPALTAQLCGKFGGQLSVTGISLLAGPEAITAGSQRP